MMCASLGRDSGGVGMTATTATRAEICVVACAEAWRGDGEILASPIGLIPTLGSRLAAMMVKRHRGGGTVTEEPPVSDAPLGPADPTLGPHPSSPPRTGPRTGKEPAAS